MGIIALLAELTFGGLVVIEILRDILNRINSHENKTRLTFR